MKSLLSLLLLIACSFAALAQQKAPTAQPALIPYPASLVPQAGSFTITGSTKLVLAKEAAVFQKEAEQLQELLANGIGKKLATTKKPSNNSMLLQYDKTITAPEGYLLTVTPAQVTLAAKEPAGMFRAIQTLRQLLPPTIEKKQPQQLVLPALQIKDQPAFDWRGMHLDVSRHFFSTDYLRKYIDLLALYKFNKLHLHLTDDQGWRIEIKKYPKLTEEGAWRTFNNHDSVVIAKSKENPDFALEEKHLVQRNGKILYGGFYTQAEMKEIISYAASKHIEIIPEIDMPGHMMAAINAYPILACDEKTGWGKDFSIPVCPCNESTFTFAEAVLTEIADLFPSQYIHIGADEVEKTTWTQSAACKELMQKEGLKNVNELQSYFVHRIEKFLQSKNKKVIGWDEMLDGGVAPSAVVMYWRSWEADAPLKAARNGNQIIMTPVNTLYFDALPDKNSLEKVYNFQVIPDGLNTAEAKLVLGAQANLWTEYIPSENRAEYLYMPRMTALAEVVWTNRKDYDSYQARLKEHYKRLTALDVHYRVPDLTGFSEESVFVDQATLQVQKPLDNLTIRYTTDGSLPGSTSPVLDKPLPITQTATIKLAAFTPEGLKGDTYTINYKKQNYAAPAKATATQAGLQATYVAGSFKSADDIAKTAGTKNTVTVKTVQVPPQAKADKFGVQFRGYLAIPETGIYTFYLTCDDGGILRIADRMVVDNDGLHSAIEKSGQVALQKGLQPIALDFIEGGGGYTLKLTYSKDGSTPQEIPESWLKQ
ncbi:family 20 glycosylhydrolase [Pontibacter qinzhouensis]|uniref:beta-N-acetylhexosaminidase n=1 Tax=Pontibacter qinzhouensis TaxID=2603253 RepID=A0A5C8IVU7_9BACT|nr:family 20 glycosylhydrolase [Pontibacter qinzhouensis]TXK24932.1 family 20 glycosylhydrolase [Pontibacter qinzhouensis]